MKTEHRAKAIEVLEDTGVQLTEDGEDLAHMAEQFHLGAVIWSQNLSQHIWTRKLPHALSRCLTLQILQIFAIAGFWTICLPSVYMEIRTRWTMPRSAYAGFVFGLRHQWSFFQRTMPTAGDHMQPLKDAIDRKTLAYNSETHFE